ncbi:MAG: purine-nucleoside phosphorylase [Brevinema sp.]
MLYNKTLIEEAAAFLKSQGISNVSHVVVLGSGLSHIADTFESSAVVSYEKIPGMHVSTVKGHDSKIIYTGKTAFLKGRMHMYEGYSAFQSAFPVALMAELGAKNLIVTNAAGGLNPSFRPGDIMMIEDHIKTQVASPLEGILTNDRFVDMQNAYDMSYYEKLAKQFPLKKGVYISTLGPQYETPAEVRYFQTIGGDSVGMSTVMETIMARYCQMKVFGFSMITNSAAGLPGAVLEHEDVVHQADETGKTLGQMIRCLLEYLG